jgi:HSP20 family protein
MGEKKERSLEAREWSPLRSWSPFRDFGSGLGRLFDEAITERAFPAGRWAPAIDVSESDGAYLVTVELPGAKREDLSLEVSHDVLTIRGEKKSEREEKNEKRHYVERSYGSFSRSFTLAANADAERVKATFKDGVLTVEVPKTEAPKPKAIDIKS